jgi:hypothetical protein
MDKLHVADVCSQPLRNDIDNIAPTIPALAESSRPVGLRSENFFSDRVGIRSPTSGFDLESRESVFAIRCREHRCVCASHFDRRSIDAFGHARRHLTRGSAERRLLAHAIRQSRRQCRVALPQNGTKRAAKAA